MNRIYIFTGKGGVGKSSIAAAHAIKSATEGKKTLLVSTDMAHNLGDIFERRLGKEAENVLPNLDIYEIDPEYVMENNFSSVMKYLGNLLSEVDDYSLQDMGMMPGMEELFSLLKIADIYNNERYERIIVDCAPTGETLALLKFPELLSWYMEKLFPIGKVGVRMLAPISKSVFKVEMPNKNAMNDIEKMYLKLVELQELLKNRDITSIRIVTTPEKMVVEETKRNYMYMNLYNFNVDGLYINRILPQNIKNDFFDQWIIIDRKIDKEPTRLAENLYAMEIDTVYESEKSWGNLKDYFKQLLTMKSGSGIEVEELLVFPGLEELFSMFKILEMYENGDYDTIIVDCAPTGETLALLKYPERLSGMIKKVLPVKKAGVKSVGPVVEKVMKIPMPKDNVFDDIEYLMDKMQRLQDLMLNKEVVSLRVVTTPEKIVINEAKRNFTCLYLYHYNVDAVIVNHIYPAKAMDGYFNKWIKLQEDALQEIKESFSEVPRFYVELQQQELRTLDVLRLVGNHIFEGSDPDDVLFKKEIYSIDNEKKCLKIYLPFADKEELRLEQDKNELIVGVRNERRKFPIPDEFAGKEIVGAKFEEGYLTISF